MFIVIIRVFHKACDIALADKKSCCSGRKHHKRLISQNFTIVRTVGMNIEMYYNANV